MKKLFTILLLAGMSLSVTNLWAQEKAEKTAETKSTGAEDATMAAWEKYMTPGEMHKLLASAVGEWKAEITTWNAPGMEPTKSMGSCNYEMILGGRYQEGKFEGNMMGMPFEGKGLVGYDNLKKMFVSTWIDNMGTGVMYSEGTYDEKTKSINFKGSMMDPMTGKDVKVREVYTMLEDNHHVFTMYTMHDGKEFKSMEISYLR